MYVIPHLSNKILDFFWELPWKRINFRTSFIKIIYGNIMKLRFQKIKWKILEGFTNFQKNRRK